MEFLRIGPQDKFCAKLKLKNLQLLNYYGKVVIILGYSLEIYSSVMVEDEWWNLFLWLVCQIEVEQTRNFWARAAKVISKEIVAQPRYSYSTQNTVHLHWFLPVVDLSYDLWRNFIHKLFVESVLQRTKISMDMQKWQSLKINANINHLNNGEECAYLWI